MVHFMLEQFREGTIGIDAAVRAETVPVAQAHGFTAFELNHEIGELIEIDTFTWSTVAIVAVLYIIIMAAQGQTGKGRRLAADAPAKDAAGNISG